jgi:hypothetical protein
LFSTYFGGDRNEEGLAIAVDSQGNIYLAGRASSTNLPVKNAIQPKMAGGGQDAFIAKYTPDYQLAYATYLGGTAGTDNIHSIAIGPDDSLFVTGESMSPSLATPEAYIRAVPAYSSFLAKLTPAGDAISYFTYVGWKGGYTSARGLAVDAQGRAHVVGYTSSKELPVTPNAIQPAYAGGSRDAFLMRVNAGGTDAEHLTYLGGSTKGSVDPDETASAVKVDAHGFVYVAGSTSSADFPGRRLIQDVYAGGQDAYLIRLDLDNSQILYSTFWGGQKKETGFALALGPGEAATLVGESYSDDLPLSNAVQTRLGSANDAYVMQICDPWLVAWPTAAATFNYIRGSVERPAAQETGIYSRCQQTFEITGMESDQSWLTVKSDGNTVPAKLTLEVNPDGLEPGEYSAVIRISIDEAFYKTLEIPVSFTVHPPPPPPTEEQ